jgi:hypothetical protein
MFAIDDRVKPAAAANSCWVSPRRLRCLAIRAPVMTDAVEMGLRSSAVTGSSLGRCGAVRAAGAADRIGLWSAPAA